MKKKKKGHALALYAFVMTMIAAGLFAACLYLVFVREGQGNGTAANEDYDIIGKEAAAGDYSGSDNVTEDAAVFKSRLKEMSMSGFSLIQILRYFYPDELVIADEGSFHFYGIQEGLKKHSLKHENFWRNGDGTVEYLENGVSAGIKGIDISKYNGEVDWQAVYDSGVRFAFIRAGIRGYGSGKIVKDEFFDDNVENAAAAGIEVGTYFLTQAVNEAEAIEEADFVLECISGKNITCPVAYDLEKIYDSATTPRTDSLTKEQHTKNTIAFCERIKEAGYTPIIYGNIKTFLVMLDMAELEPYQKWFAGYISKDEYTPYFPYEMRVWQYSESGSVPGVSGKCDLDIAFY